VIEAAARLRSRFPAIRVILAGHEPPYARGFTERLLAIARAQGVLDRLELAGWVDSIEEVLSGSTIYVQPSCQSEGLGLSIAEASWAGLPVVASRAAGTSEAMIDGRTGTLVAPGDPAALACAIARYLADPDTAHAAGEAGCRFARERFNPQIVSGQWYGALEACATPSRRCAVAGTAP
jgi:glycosyltransferase involved in cell wall biosynthesis